MLGRAVALQFGQAALVPELHSEADNRAALLQEEGGDGRGIDATGHGDGHQSGLDRSPGGQPRLEL